MSRPQIKAQEVALQDRNDALRFAPGGKRNDFSAFRRTINDTQIKPLRAYLNELARSGNEAAARAAATRRPASGAGGGSGSASVASTPASSASGGACSTKRGGAEGRLVRC